MPYVEPTTTESTPVDGKDFLVMVKSPNMAKTDGPGVPGNQGDFSISGSRDGESVATKQGTITSAGTLEETGSLEIYFSDDDPTVDMFMGSIKSGDLLDMWLVDTNINRAKENVVPDDAEIVGLSAQYTKIRVNSYEQSYPVSGLVTLSIDYTADGGFIKNDVDEKPFLMSKEAIVAAQTVREYANPDEVGE